MNTTKLFYKNIVRYLLLIISITGSYTVFANHDDHRIDNRYGANNGGYDNNYNGSQYRGSNQSQGVTLYRDCDFSGKADTLDFGDYHSLKRSSVGNDAISSIRVPQGMVVIVYEDNNFEGEQERFYQTTSCVPKRWNDRISSLQVLSANSQQAQDNWRGGNNSNRENPYYGNNQNSNNYIPSNNRPNNSRSNCYNYKVSSHGGAGAFRFTDKPDNVIKLNNNAKNGNTCLKGKVRIELSKTQKNVTTVFEVNGQRYTFAANERHDSYKNNWYRKYIDVYLP